MNFLRKRKTSLRTSSSADATFSAQASYGELRRRLHIPDMSARLDTEHPFKYRYLVRGEELYSENAKLEEFFVVSSGCLKVEISQPHGRVISRFVMSGDVLGIEGIYNGCYNCNVFAIANTTLIAVPYNRFRALCRNSDEFNVAFVRYVARRIYDQNQHVRMLAAANAQTKVANFLIWLSERTNDSGLPKHLLTLHMSRAELASYVGLTVETVCRMLGRLRDARLIDVAGNRVEIKNYFSLAHLAQRTRQPVLGHIDTGNANVDALVESQLS